MRSSLAFFRVFPPPKFMLMPHSGLDISDDGMCFISYSGFGGTRHISSFDKVDFPSGLFSGGDIADEKEFVSRLAEFGKKNNLSNVKISIPEEKAYLFQAEVPSTEQKVIEQNIEFKLEENVPLTASDAVFYFELLPRSATSGLLKASVSVVPKAYIEHYMTLIESAGLRPISFETSPNALARSAIPVNSEKTRLLIHVMKNKTGIYIVSGSVIHFTFTLSFGSEKAEEDAGLSNLKELYKEIGRIRTYWFSHGNGMDIEEALLVGQGAANAESIFSINDGDFTMKAKIADVWCNAINIEEYLPSISKQDSLEYAVAAGLAFNTAKST